MLPLFNLRHPRDQVNHIPNWEPCMYVQRYHIIRLRFCPTHTALYQVRMVLYQVQGGLGRGGLTRALAPHMPVMTDVFRQIVNATVLARGTSKLIRVWVKSKKTLDSMMNQYQIWPSGTILSKSLNIYNTSKYILRRLPKESYSESDWYYCTQSWPRSDTKSQLINVSNVIIMHRCHLVLLPFSFLSLLEGAVVVYGHLFVQQRLVRL